MKTAKTKPPKSVSRFTLHESASASALILAVVLTSLLAIIGVMFVMIARVDKMATSAISENKELNFAVETVVAKISQELVLDVPRTDSNGLKLSEYYDYPDANNAWLASLEPYDDGGTYKWRQISDVTGFLNVKNFATQDVSVDPPGTRKYIQEYPEITLDASGVLEDLWADADGDGIADSKWVELDDITSNKGKPIYAAIRIVDNGGMINVNTAYKFDPNSAVKNEIDGSSQLQINLKALARGTSNIEDINKARNPKDRLLSEYERDVIWKIEDPCSDYLPFDISDELELRNRFLCTSSAESRIEQKEVWNSALDNGQPGPLYVPYIPFGQDTLGLDDWKLRMNADSPEDRYERRHILTTYNMDRIIDPDCNKMTNINKADAYSIYRAVKSALDPNFVDANGVAAQIAVNLIDFRDNDANVISTLDVNGTIYYGFERPLVYISEIVYKIEADSTPGGPNAPAYAIELYKPDFTDDDPCNWRLLVKTLPAGGPLPPPPPPPGVPYDITWSGDKQLYAMLNDPCGILPPDPGAAVEYSPALVFEGQSTIELQRRIDEVNDIWITVDSIVLPDWLFPAPAADETCSFKRDITLHKCIRRLWDTSGSTMGSPSIGQINSYTFIESPDIIIQAHPENKLFTNIGEIGMVFRKSAYSEDPNAIGSTDTEATVRIDFTKPEFQQILKYLTVFDPYNFHPDDPNYADETRIKGRININTAPWFVLAQLPWVSQRKNEPANYKLAQAIVAYRERLNLSLAGGPDYYHSGASNSRELETGINGLREEPGFESIGELATVINNSSGKEEYSMSYYTLGSEIDDLDGFPDLTTLPTGGDGAEDDFEERDVIFSRISNLVTVRSDVFTAYILVRIGTDGPQKRVMAILDRSDVYSPTDKVRVVALHPVPDPR